MPRKFEQPTWIAGGSIRGGSGISTFLTDLSEKLQGPLILSHARRSLANYWDEYLQFAKVAGEKDEKKIWTNFIHKIYQAFLAGPEELIDLLAEYQVIDSSEPVLAQFNEIQKTLPFVKGPKKRQELSVGFLNVLPDVLRDYELLEAIHNSKRIPTADGKLATLAPRIAQKRVADFPKVKYLKHLVPPEEGKLGIVFTVEQRVGSIRMLKRDLLKGNLVIEADHGGISRVIDSAYVIEYLDGKNGPPPGFTKEDFHAIVEKYLVPYEEKSSRRFQGDQRDFSATLGVNFPDDVVRQEPNKAVQDTSYLSREEAQKAAIRAMNHVMPGFASFLFLRNR
jgi:hypothetical protein